MWCKKWGQAHSRVTSFFFGLSTLALNFIQAHFAILKCLLRDGKDFMTVNFNPNEESLIVHVDRSRMFNVGKPALSRMLLHLHMYRSTADVAACRAYYEDLSRVDGIFLEWRKVVIEQRQPKWAFVQANTFKVSQEIKLVEYPPTPAGVLQSWVERRV